MPSIRNIRKVVGKYSQPRAFNEDCDFKVPKYLKYKPEFWAE